jgi:hypothetical protein
MTGGSTAVVDGSTNAATRVMRDALNIGVIRFFDGLAHDEYWIACGSVKRRLARMS